MSIEVKSISRTIISFSTGMLMVIFGLSLEDTTRKTLRDNLLLRNLMLLGIMWFTISNIYPGYHWYDIIMIYVLAICFLKQKPIMFYTSLILAMIIYFSVDITGNSDIQYGYILVLVSMVIGVILLALDKQKKFGTNFNWFSFLFALDKQPDQKRDSKTTFRSEPVPFVMDGIRND